MWGAALNPSIKETIKRENKVFYLLRSQQLSSTCWMVMALLHDIHQGKLSFHKMEKQQKCVCLP